MFCTPPVVAAGMSDSAPFTVVPSEYVPVMDVTSEGMLPLPVVVNVPLPVTVWPDTASLN